MRLVEATGSASASREVDTVGQGQLPIDPELMSPPTLPTPPPPYSRTDISSSPPSVERYMRPDGSVGVVISNSPYGGWSTNFQIRLDPRIPGMPAKTRKMEEISLFDKDIVAAVLADDIPRVRATAIAKMGLPNSFRFDDVELVVEWVDAGEEFEVVKYTDFEFIRRKRLIVWWHV